MITMHCMNPSGHICNHGSSEGIIMVNADQPQYMLDFERIYAVHCGISCIFHVQGPIKINLTMNMYIAYLEQFSQ